MNFEFSNAGWVLVISFALVILALTIAFMESIRRNKANDAYNYLQDFEGDYKDNDIIHDLMYFYGYSEATSKKALEEYRNGKSLNWFKQNIK